MPVSENRQYNSTIGLEIHVELKTKSKMFCDSPNGLGLENEPNVNICSVCTGQPGTLPVINEEAVHMVLKTGLALNAQIQNFSKFDRKNYFYPDLPKGYQISQYDKPLVLGGYMDIDSSNEINHVNRIRIRRVHLEEDTGKLIHPKGANYSFVDFNRAGVPLMELVTEPDIKSGSQARKFCQELQLILRYLGVSDADMEKGQMRCEVNISLSGGKELGTKVEIKNLNSFRSVERSIDYEIKRQTEELEAGKKIIQETRGWDNTTSNTFSQRIKEEAYDYRYFPEPDLPPLTGLDKLAEKLLAEMPELPKAKIKRFAQEYKLPDEDIGILVNKKELGDYFECVASELKDWAQEAEPKIDTKKATKLAVNYLITEMQKLLVQTGIAFGDLKITPENFAEFTKLTMQGVVSSSGAQTVLKEMFKTGADPSRVIQDKRLAQVSDEEELEKTAAEVISQNPSPVQDFKKGKEKALMFLVGKLMAFTKGRANPKIAEEIFRRLLK